MHAARILSTCNLVKPLYNCTVCRRVLDAAAGRADLHMLAQDLPIPRRSVSLHQFKATWNFGRAAYCISSPVADRSLRRLISPRPRLTAHFTSESAAPRTRQCERSYVCAAASVLDANTATSTSQPSVPKFGRRTCIKDVKVRQSPDCKCAFRK